MVRATLPGLSRQSTIGWIGLGAMGHPMALNLFTKTYMAHRGSNGSKYLICEADDVRAEAFISELRERGGVELASKVERVGNGRAMALAASRILTMLPSTPQVEAVYLDPQDGILAGLTDLLNYSSPSRSGSQSVHSVVSETTDTLPSSSRTSSPSSSAHAPSLDSSAPISPCLSPLMVNEDAEPPHTLLIDHTTLDPTAAIRLSSQIHNTTSGQAVMVDAPVSGGTSAAAKGQLTIMLGSPSPLITQHARSLLETMAREGGIWECGSNGAGIGVKVCNNLMLAINQIALSEGLALGRSLGIDPTLLHSVINSSSGQSWSSKVNSPLSQVPESPGSRGYSGGFQSRLMLKDVGLALSAAHAHDIPTPLTWAAKSVYEAVCEDENHTDWATKDFSVVYEWIKEMQKRGVEKGWKEDPTST